MACTSNSIYTVWERLLCLPYSQSHASFETLRATGQARLITIEPETEGARSRDDLRGGQVLRKKILIILSLKFINNFYSRIPILAFSVK